MATMIKNLDNTHLDLTKKERDTCSKEAAILELMITKALLHRVFNDKMLHSLIGQQMVAEHGEKPQGVIPKRIQIDHDFDQEEVFKAMALVMGVMEMLIRNNAKKGQIQAELSRINAKEQERNFKKAIDALKKIADSENSHGIWGWICDFFKSLVEGLEKLAKDIATHDFSDLEQRGLDLLGVGMIRKLCIDISQGKSWDECLEDCVKTILMGPLGSIMEGTSFAKDLNDAVKLVVDTVVTVQAGLIFALSGASNQEIGAFVKAHGKAILQNPALHAVLDIAALVVIVGAALSQQYWLAGILLVVLVMNQTDSDGNSLMSEFTGKALVPMLEGMGISKEVSKVLADVIVLVIVIAVTAGVGGFSSAAEEGSSIASTEIEELAESASEELVSDVTEEGATNNIENVLKKAFNKAKNIFKKVVTRNVGLTAMETAMVFGSTGFSNDFATLIAKDDEKLKRELAILMEVLTVVMGVIGGLGMSASLPDSMEVNSSLKNLFPALGKYMEENGTKLLEIGKQLQVAGFLGQGYADVCLGADNCILGFTRKILSEIQAATTITDSMEKMNGQQIQSNQEDLKKLTREEIQFVKNMAAPSSAIMGEVQALLA